MNSFVIPDYQGACLSNLVPSIAARLTGAEPVVPIPEAGRYVILLIDGLGWDPVVHNAAHSSLFAPALDQATRLTSGVPSTTATSLTSIGCGSHPGSHGVVGYSFLDPATDCVVNALTWDGGPADVAGFACQATQYTKLQGQGIHSGCVSLARFTDSALQQLAFGGTSHFPVEREEDARTYVGLVLEALATNTVVYAYERRLDHEGHAHGVGSWQWLLALTQAEELVNDLNSALPWDTCLLVTGDHGMINVPRSHQIVIEDHRALSGARRVGGEPRLRQLYTDRPRELAASWAEALEDRAEVWLRDDAIDAGWFGSVSDRVRPRIGDVLVPMRENWAINSRALPKEFSLVGQHGSLTPAEMWIPLFTFGPA